MLDRILKLSMLMVIVLMLGIITAARIGQFSNQLPPLAYVVETARSYSQYIIDLQQGIHTRVHYQDNRYSYSPNLQWQSRADYNGGNLDIFIKQRHTTERLLGSYPFVALDTRLIWDSDSTGIFVLNKLPDKSATLVYIAVPSGEYRIIGEYDISFLPSRIRRSSTGRYLTLYSLQYQETGLIIDTHTGDALNTPNSRYIYWANDDRYTLALTNDNPEQLINYNTLVYTTLPEGDTFVISSELLNAVLKPPLHIAPNGNFVAADIHTGGVMLMNIETMMIEQLTNAHQVVRGWSADSERLVVLQQSDSVFRSQLVAINVVSGEIVPLMRGRSGHLLQRTVLWSPDDRYLMLYLLTSTSEQPLRIVDSITGAPVFEGDVERFANDGQSWFYWYDPDGL